MAMLMLGLRAADTLLVRTETESQMRETQRVMHMQVSPPQSTDVATFTDAPTPSRVRRLSPKPLLETRMIWGFQAFSCS